MGTTAHDGGFEWSENQDRPGTATLARYRGSEEVVAVPARTEPEGLLVTSIGKEVFCGCESLRSIEIPWSVREIGWGAFSECKSLRGVVIPEGVREIGDWAFYGCPVLSDVYFRGTEAQWGALAPGVFDSCPTVHFGPA